MTKIGDTLLAAGPGSRITGALDAVAGFSEAPAPFVRSDSAARGRIKLVQPAARVPRRPRLGELALNAGLIAPDELSQCLEQHRASGTRLGESMVSSGVVSAVALTCLLAVQSDQMAIDLGRQPPDPTLANAADLDFYIAHQCLPWRWRNREAVYVAADPDAARSAIEALEGRPCLIHLATPRAIRHHIQERFHVELSERARLSLARTRPESSAQHRLSSAQALVCTALVVALATLFFFAPASMTLFLNLAFATCFLAIAALRCVSILGAWRRGRQADMAEAPAAPVRIPDRDLPVFTVMVPLFREASVLPILTQSLSKLDYPASKLQLMLIFEETDTETMAAAKALRLPDKFEFILVPHSMPLTKPKACNYALNFARGKYLVIYDAEDLPEPDQLRRAVAAFAAEGDDLACVQARLNYYNQFENWLTRQFTLEYTAFFDLLLPTLAWLRFPIPLGGTSTHFRTEILRSVGAWDPFNVTEDADLGMRLAMLGYRTGLIHSTTFEEANCRIGNWLRQRSRWIKGWIQTYFVRMRHPVRLYRSLGARGFLGFQLVIGGFSISNLVHPIFYLTLIAETLRLQFNGHGGLPFSSGTGHQPVVAFNIAVLLCGYAMSIIAGMMAAAQRGLPSLMLSALAMPAYWLLISWGAYKALFQFITRPFHWEKTEHGISSLWVQKHADALRENRGRTATISTDPGNTTLR